MVGIESAPFLEFGALGIVFYQVYFTNKHHKKSQDEGTKAIQALSKSQAKNTEAIKALTTVISGCPLNPKRG